MEEEQPGGSDSESAAPVGGKRTRRFSALGDHGDVRVPVRAGLSEKQVQDLREIFGLFDLEGVGRIAPSAVRAAAQEVHMDRDSPEIWRVVSTLSSEDLVDFEQFVSLVTEPLGDLSANGGASRSLALFGQGAVSAGSIGMKDLQRLVDDLALQVPEDDLREMLAKAGAGSDDRLGLEDFGKVLLASGGAASEVGGKQ